MVADSEARVGNPSPELPKLPIPPLADTLARYLASLKALQSHKEHERTKRVVREFEVGGEGERCQRMLEEYAKDRDSFVEEFWDESYLSGSDPVVLNLNPFFLLEDDPTPARGNQLMRATSLILASLGFVHDLRTGVLPKDQFRGVPLDMYQYSRMFGTVRIPTETGCRTEIDPLSRHIVVMSRGQFYWFEALDHSHRPLLTEHSLHSILSAIVTDSAKLPANEVARSSFGVLTTENRKVWAGLRRGILDGDWKEGGQGSNKENLEIVDKALFVVCLDHEDFEGSEGGGMEKMCETLLCGTSRVVNGVQVGTCTNRYYDKLQIIVAKNGAAGINFEHSLVDGHTVLRFVGDVYTDLILRFAKSINPSSSTLFQAKLSPYSPHGPGKKRPTSPTGAAGGSGGEEGDEADYDTTPKKLEWNLTPQLRLGIRFAESRISDLICQNEVKALEFGGYGKNFITRHGFSPDAFVQMAFQAAYFLLYGRTECTYEPAMVKTFKHGRTEAIRTVRPESVDFVATYTSDESPRKKIEALRKACKVHTELTKQCSKGLGQDRILYAMYCLANKALSSTASKGKNGIGKNGDSGYESDDSDEVEMSTTMQLPAIFRDPGYATLNHSTLSTSNCGNPALRLFGFGPVVADGFGMGYIIKDESISVCASSKHLQTQRFLDTLQAYLLDVQKLIIQLFKDANVRRSETFVDHQLGIVDSRTGKPLKSNLSREDQEEQVYGGYGFFDSGEVQSETAMRERALRRQKSAVGTRLTLHDY
ncbi:acyltransferase ChoActase/COT/CPT [Atractiella rhizophila]|nr:acyltransferase ChoActase/COT/CPT [Atractiella rhizophila]